MSYHTGNIVAAKIISILTKHPKLNVTRLLTQAFSSAPRKGNHIDFYEDVRGMTDIELLHRLEQAEAYFDEWSKYTVEVISNSDNEEE